MRKSHVHDQGNERARLQRELREALEDSDGHDEPEESGRSGEEDHDEEGPEHDDKEGRNG
jgi:hypothetical protein